MHIDRDLDVRLWIGIGRAESGLQVVAFRPKIVKLRDDR